MKQVKIWEFWTDKLNNVNGVIVAKNGCDITIHTENKTFVTLDYTRLLNFSLSFYNQVMRTSWGK